MTIWPELHGQHIKQEKQNILNSQTNHLSIYNSARMRYSADIHIFPFGSSKPIANVSYRAHSRTHCECIHRQSHLPASCLCTNTEMWLTFRSYSFHMFSMRKKKSTRSGNKTLCSCRHCRFGVRAERTAATNNNSLVVLLLGLLRNF